MPKPVILCVDDEKIIINSLTSELRNFFGEHYIVESAESGTDAITLFKDLVLENNEIPLIITDYLMPEMKGDELLKQVHAISPSTLKILLTGQATLEGVTNAINWANLYRYIGKPWEKDDLRLTVSEAIKSYFKDRKLEEQNEELRKFNQTLEQKVKDRTAQLQQANEEITAQRDIVTEQKQHIEHIYAELTDSIRYAERIQNAVLPHEQYIKERIKGEFFILFKPRDIVSGDFYFVEKRKNWLFVTVADCTGHGVPGAFMSMLGISFLNEIIAKEEIQSANQVLDELRRYVIHSLQQRGVEGEQQDGMDMAFLVLNTETLELQYAGANNPLYIIRKQQDTVAAGSETPELPTCLPAGKATNYQLPTANCQLPTTNYQLPTTAANRQLLELKADKMPVGIYQEMHPFKNHNIKVNKGDRLYIFSDGFEDQFGGEKRKKFLSKRFKESLLQIAHLHMPEQREKLNNIFENWKGKTEQIDDVTVLGIKIS
ncbi:MAG: SpoIIE family protein phosphatase [Bacteroidia bacterium]|nr:SpoIIE family protein phosphatase [Bacteroidia bacterium]